jgi:hypothetical protein
MMQGWGGLSAQGDCLHLDCCSWCRCWLDYSFLEPPIDNCGGACTITIMIVIVGEPDPCFSRYYQPFKESCNGVFPYSLV